MYVPTIFSSGDSFCHPRISSKVFLVFALCGTGSQGAASHFLMKYRSLPSLLLR